MLFYCLKYEEKTDGKPRKFVKTKNGRIIVIRFAIVKNQDLSKCKKPGNY